MVHHSLDVFCNYLLVHPMEGPQEEMKVEVEEERKLILT